MRVLALLRWLIGDRAKPAASEQAVDKAAEVYQLAYTEAVRRLQGQEASLDELRTRAGTIMAAATIVTSFLGARFLDSTKVPGLLWLALGAFVLCMMLALICLIPFSGWRWYFGTRKLISEYIEGPQPESLAETQRDLALHLEDNYNHNEIRLGRLYWIFAVAGFALFIEVVAWLGYQAGICS